MPTPWDRRRVVYRRPIGAVPTRRADEQPEEYVARRDEDVRRQIEVDREATERARREAYDRGIREGRRSKRSNPLLTLVVIILAVLGLVFIGLWIRSGSPSEAGAQIGRGAEAARTEALDAAAVAGDRVAEEIDERNAPTTPAPGTAAPATPADGAATTTTTTSTTSTPPQ